jgi:aminoglycoside phosphotransferase (APT) family kinase protein
LTDDERRARLEVFVREASGASAARVPSLKRLAGGASREIWSFDAELDRGGSREELRLVVRVDPPGHEGRSSRREEFEILGVATEAGVPVPKPYWLCEDRTVLGASFIIMERIEGEALARRLLRDERYAETRRVLCAELGGALARIHAIDPARLPFLARPTEGQTAAEFEVERYRQIYDSITPDPHPAIELALRWLATHLPGPSPIGVVHGDFRIGNVMFDERGLRAVLDWELYHAGDPIEDLGWLCVRAWRFGNDRKPVGGVGEREELFAAYERASGRAVDRRRAHFWELFGNCKWAIICIMQAKTHLDGTVKSVELASLGRRTAETEIELVELLEAS